MQACLCVQAWCVCLCARVRLYTQVDEYKCVPVGMCVHPCVRVPVCASVCARMSLRTSPSAALPLSTPQRARHKDHITGVTWLLLEAVELDPGSIYEARLRVQMATLDDVFMEEERYEGQWSEWSQSVSCSSPQRPGGPCVAAALRESGLGLPALLPFSLPGTPPPGSHAQLTPLPWRSEVCMEETNSHQTGAFQELAVSSYGWE